MKRADAFDIVRGRRWSPSDFGQILLRIGQMREKSDNREDYQDIDRPIGGMRKDFPAGCVVTPHSHTRSQILFAASGVMEVSTSLGVWIVPPVRAVWLPANITHWMRTRTGASVRSVYIRPDYCPPTAPREPRLIAVSSLLRELLIEMADIPTEYNEMGRDGLVAALLVRCVNFLPDPPLSLSQPSDPRLVKMHQALLDDPSDSRTLEDWADQLGASSRAIARLLKNDAGMSFLTWRQQIRLLAALPRLAAGEPVTAVALDLGYDTPSAFSAMFSRQLGRAPSQFFCD